MGVTDGQPVSAAVTNPAFLDANNDDVALGKIDFNNISDPGVSGPGVFNIQREANAVSSFIGKPTGVAIGALPPWTHNEVGAPTDDLFLRGNNLTERFNGTTGHLHDGSDGEGPNIPGANISLVPLQGFFNEGLDLIGVTGSSTDVSTELTGKTPSSGSASLGVVVTGSYNKVTLRHASGVNENDQIDDGLGNIVYGRVTESVGVWTLSYYVLLSGTETAYTFGSATDVRWYYQELYNPMTSTPVYSQLSVIPSDNATADVLDATETQAGKVLLSNVSALPVAATGAKGTSARVSHEDHVHEGVHTIFVDGDLTTGRGDVTFKGIGPISLAWNLGKIEVSITTPVLTPQVEYRTITSLENTAKAIVLSALPTSPTKVVLDIIGGSSPQWYSVDYTVSGSTLSWATLGLDGILSTGDTLRIIYWS